MKSEALQLLQTSTLVYAIIKAHNWFSKELQNNLFFPESLSYSTIKSCLLRSSEELKVTVLRYLLYAGVMMQYQ